MDSFASRLNQAIHIRDLSQAELARRSGIGRNSISDYLKGKYEAKQDKLFSLASALDVNESWLMGYPGVTMEKANITSLYNQLRPDRQKSVLGFAAHQLAEQARDDYSSTGKVNEPGARYESNTEGNDHLQLLAAHIDDATPEEREEIYKWINKTLREKKD